MMDWQPIDTAPVGKPVLLGRYVVRYWIGSGANGSEKITWDTSVGVARSYIWPPILRIARMTRDGDDFTHWMPLPQPPKESADG